MAEQSQQILEALNQPGGARFWRCALQVNPSTYAENFRGASANQEDVFNAELAAACKRNGVEVVGIADHGSVEQVDRLRAALQSEGVLVFPGFETQSTEKVHIVCLYPAETAIQDLQQYLGALGAGIKDGQTRPSSLSAEEIGKKVGEQGGVCFLAHVTLKAGVLGLKMNHVWRSEVFTAAQIEGPVSKVDFAFADIVANKNAEYKRKRAMCLIHARDVARPEDLDDQFSSTLVKMTSPSIGALRQAFLDPGSRVRFVAEAVAADHGRIVAVAWEGGFLDGVRLRASDNLNAVVGGRGTGKSTVIETLRYAFGATPRGARAKEAHDEIVLRNLEAGGRIYVQVCSAAQLGREYTIIREFNGPPEVRDDRNQPSRLTPAELLPGIEILGHDEILEVTKDASAVRSLVESFVPSESGEQDSLRTTVRHQLAENRTQLVTAHDALEALQSSLAKLPKLDEQMRLYREHGIEQKLAAQARVTRGRELVKRFQEEFSTLAAAQKAFEQAIPVGSALPEDLSDLPGAEQLRGMRTALNDLLGEMRQLAKAASDRIVNARETMNALRVPQQEAARKIEHDLALVVRALPSHNGASGAELARDFRKVVEEAERIRPDKEKLEGGRTMVSKLKEARKRLLAEWRDAERARYDALKRAAEAVSQGPLSGKLRVSVTAAGDRSALKTFLLTLEGVGAKKTEWVDAAPTITVHGLVDALDAGKDSLLKAFQSSGLTASVASTLCALSASKKMELEEVELLPTVAIELNVSHSEHPPRFRPLDQLSTGQRCTAILYILLAKGNAPLIIDQPEDHLDNAFIADLIVEKLRSTKLKRQFFFATHNANIPVLGDAELIAVLKADSRSAKLTADAVGSVDKPEIQRLAADVLEGGHEAFTKRQRKYGF